MDRVMLLDKSISDVIDLVNTNRRKKLFRTITFRVLLMERRE